MGYTGHIMTLANSIIGVGILAMPFCFQKCGIILSIALLVLSNLVTQISCHYLLKSSLLTRRKSFEFLAFHAFGSSGKLMVELCIIGYLIGTCITYFVVVGDLGPQIVAKLFNVSESHKLRTWVMIIVTFLCIIPLGLLKNVDSLAAVCTASIGFYFCLVVKVMFEARSHISSSDWTENIDYWKPAGILQCLPIFSMALACQMQLFEVLESINGATLEKLNQIVRKATTICTGVYIFVGFFGYVAFCRQHFSGNILVNFSPSFVSDAIKIGFVLSVAFSFPLAIFPCRASIYSLLYRRGHSDSSGYMPEIRFKCITISIVLLALLMGLLIPSIELVIGLVGSTIGVAICILFPASCFMKMFKKDSTEKLLAQVIVVCGFCLMILGTYANLHAIDEKRSGAESADIIKTLTSPIAVLTNENMKMNDNLKDINKIIIDDVLRNVIKSEHKVEIQKRVSPLKEGNVFITKFEPDPGIENPREKTIIENKNDKNAVKFVELKIEPKQDVPPRDNIKVANIEMNKDAIKKEDEVEAEEEKKANIEEIKQAKKDLKKTKELIEKRVSELKEELGDIEEKVAEIEGKVLQDSRADNDKASVPAQNKVKINIEIPQVINHVLTKEKISSENNSTIIKQIASNAVQSEPQNATIVANITAIGDKELPERGPILTILTENLQSKAAAADNNQRKDDPIYEPISYKVGEILNQESHPSIDKIVPLPLSILLNATVDKNINTIAASLAKDKRKIVENEKNADKLATIIEIRENAKQSEGEKNLQDNADRSNRESIRRDLLKVQISKDDSTLSSNNPREKRNADDKDFCINWDIVKKNCLDENIMNKLQPVGNSFDNLKLQTFGRDLKSVNDKS